MKIALTDDEVLFRKGIAMILNDNKDMEVIIEASNGQELLDKLEITSTLPDILLMDLNMPVLNGIETAKILQKKHPDIKVIILSSYFSKAFIINMMELGAAAYLAKNTEPETVEKTIREVFDKGFSYSDEVMKVIRENMLARTKPKATFKEKLSKRELEILQLICEQYKTSEIAQKLFISPRTVDGHRNNLLIKLNCRNTAGLVVYAIQNQLIEISPSRFWNQ